RSGPRKKCKAVARPFRMEVVNGASGPWQTHNQQRRPNMSAQHPTPGSRLTIVFRCFGRWLSGGSAPRRRLDTHRARPRGEHLEDRTVMTVLPQPLSPLPYAFHTTPGLLGANQVVGNNSDSKLDAKTEGGIFLANQQARILGGSALQRLDYNG